MKNILLFAVLSMAAAVVSAEKADSYKRTEIEFGDFYDDEVAQARIFTGNVILTRGTLVMHAEKAVVKEDPQGYQFVTLTAAEGKLVTFRQKRDGGPDLWVEGQAQRIEYDEKAEVAKLFVDARIKRLEGARTTDQLDSAFLSYDSLHETLSARNDATGKDKPGQGRGKMIIESNKAKLPATPAAGK